MSLRARLLAGMVALVAAGLAIAAVATYEEQRSFLHTRLEQQVLSARGADLVALRLDRGRLPASLAAAGRPPSLADRGLVDAAPAGCPTPGDLRRAARTRRKGPAATDIQL